MFKSYYMATSMELQAGASHCMCGGSFADGGTTTSDHRCAIRLDHEAPPASGEGGYEAAPPAPNHILLILTNSS